MSAPKVDVLADETKCQKSEVDVITLLGAREISLDEARKTNFSLASIVKAKGVVYVVAGNGPRGNRYFQSYLGGVVYLPGQATFYKSKAQAISAAKTYEEVFEYDPVSAALSNIGPQS